MSKPSPKFPAIFNAHGLYNSEQFVLKLSLRNHQLVDEATEPDFDPKDLTPDHITAYSTYLHETIHWWQHVGSTSGFILSMCYPAQTHINQQHLADLVKLAPPSKPIKTSAKLGELEGKTHTDEAQRSANTITNNAFDIEAFKTWILCPDRSVELYNNPYFESQGHCFNITYGSVLSLLNGTFDPAEERFINVDLWDDGFRKLSANKVEGYYYGSPMRRSKVGVVDLFEGQASFNQLVFLAKSGVYNAEFSEFRRLGYLHGVYERAFLRFLELTRLDCPDTVLDAVVSLFLLVCDVAINPVEGFPVPVTDHAKFLYHSDPGIRFEHMCLEIAQIGPAIVEGVKNCSKQEYLDVSSFLAERCGFAHSSEIWRQIENWMNHIPSIVDLMKEYDSFEFENTNIVLRVLLSHFISLNLDKKENPEFFCWPGHHKAGVVANEKVLKLWLKHLSLFADKADSEAVFTRMKPGRDPKAVLSTQDRFFGNVTVFDLTRQWILEDGPFDIDFKWLSEDFDIDTWLDWTDKIFIRLYGVGVSEIQTN